MAVKEIMINEGAMDTDVNFYIKCINKSFDKDLNTIKKYVSSLESLKDNILTTLDELNANDNSVYVHYKLNILDRTVSGLNQARSLIDDAELKAQKFIGKD